MGGTVGSGGVATDLGRPERVATASPRLFASELFASVLAASVLAADGDSMSIGVVDESGRTFGFVRRRGTVSEPVTPETPFRLASISKTITATAVLKLVDAGRVSLDDRPVESILSRRGLECRTPGISGIRVRDLLSHTSGFASGREWFFDEIVGDTTELVRRFCERDLRSTPGSRYEYSNFNFLLLGWLIEDVTGSPYDVAVDSVLLRPAGLSTFRFHETSDVARWEPDYYVDPGSKYMELLGAAGAWSASSIETATFIAGLAASESGRGYLSSSTFREMSNAAPRSAAGSSWGYGLGLRLFSGGVWGHTGSIESIKAVAIHLPDGASIAVLVNGDRPEASDELVELVVTVWWATHYVGPIPVIPPM